MTKNGYTGIAVIGAMLALSLGGVPVYAKPSGKESPKPARRDAHVVVAVIESGMNPYHDEFSRPSLTAHPSTYLPGYPAKAKALSLNLGQSDYEAALKSDAPKWDRVEPQQVYYIPGTNFVGAVHLPGHQLDGPMSVPPEDTGPFFNNTWHGTSVTSVLGGKTLGSCPECLLVLIDATAEEDGLRWAARQPWIDIVSNSWGGPMSQGGRWGGFTHPEDTLDQRAISRDVAASGKVVVFGSGNGATGTGGIVPEVPQHGTTYDSPYTGPAWVLAVGAARKNGQPSPWHDVPVDVISHGENWPSAAQKSTTEKDTFLGTSCAAPVAAGTIANALLQARRATGDYGVGSRDGSLVHIASKHSITKGPLSDGVLSRSELVEAAKSVAAWEQPASPGSFVVQGYGLLNKSRVPTLTSVLLGRTPLPERAEMKDWAQQHQAIRVLFWGEPPEGDHL